ncbi:MAG TPA: hypothetical protein VF228_16695 [Iamia sp.]
MVRGDGDQPVDADLAERVARLEAAVAAAGASLAGTGPPPRPAPAAPRSGKPTSATRKGVRTGLQVGLASIPGLGLAALTENAVFMWVATFALTPVVTYVQNEVEDRLQKGFLRDFGPADPAPPSPGADPAP